MADVKNKSVNIYIDQTSALQALDVLQKKADKLTLSIDAGRTAGKNMNAEIKKLEETKAAIANVQEQIDKGLAPSLKQQQSLVTKLNNELKLMSQSDPAFASKSAEYQKQNALLGEMRSKINGVSDAEKEMAASSSGLTKVGVAIGSFIGSLALSGALKVIESIKASITEAGHASDQLASIRRISGMTAEEVDHLNTKLSDIDTRTSLDGLREIAAVAGRLGVKKGDIADFTKQLDRLGVVFHGELGDVDTIASQLGKIVNVFDGHIDGENVSKLGNAIVALSHSGPSTAGFLSDFTQRVSAIAKASNLSLSAVLGLGAGIEETGGRVESGATAIQKILIKIAEDVPKAAKIAGQDVQKFTEDFAKTPEKALLAYAKGLQANKNSFAEIASSFKDAGEDGARVITTLSTLGQKADYFQQRIDLAYKKTADTHDLEHAADIMNNSLGASIDKLSKSFSALGNSTSVQTMLKGLVDAAISFINVLKAIPGFIKNNETAFALMAVGIATMNAGYIKAALSITLKTAAQIKDAVVTRLSAVATNIAIAAQAAYIQITGVLTGEISAATAAQRLWNIAVSLGAGPIGAIIIAAGALVLILGNLIGAFNTVSAQQRLFGEVQAKAAEDVSSQKASIDTLTNAITSNALSLDDRKKALSGLIAINPAYLSGLTLENIRTQEGKKIIDDYVDSLDRMARAKATQALKEDLYKKQVEASVKAQQAAQTAPTSALGIGVQSGLIATGMGAFTNLQKGISANEDVKKAQEDIDALNVVTQKQIADENKLIEAQQQKMKQMRENSLQYGKEDIKNSTEYKNEQAKLNDLIATRNVLMGMETTAVKAGTNALNTDLQTTGGIIDDLKAKIQALDNALGGLKTKSDIKDNRAERQKLQDELDALESKGAQSRTKKEETAREKLLKELVDFKFQLEQVGKQADESEKARIIKKYDELIKRAKEFHLSIVGLDDAEKKALAILDQKELDQKRKEFDKNFLEHAKEEYLNSLASLSQYIDEQKDIQAKSYADGIISKEQYDGNIQQLDIESQNEQILIAKDYSKVVKEAATDELKFQKQQRKENLKDAVANAELMQTLEKQAAKSRASAAVALAKNGTKQKRDALKAQLKQEYDDEMKALDDKENGELTKIKNQYAQELKLLIDQLEEKRKMELALVDPNDPGAEKKKSDINGRYDDAEKAGTGDIEKRTNDAFTKIKATYDSLKNDLTSLFTQKVDQTDADYWKGKVDEYTGYANEALDVISKFTDARTAQENAAFAKEQKQNDARKAAIQKLAQYQVISSQEAQRRTTEVQRQEDAKKEALDKKQAERKKKLAIAQTIINAAAGAIKLWLDPGFPEAIPLTVALGIETAAEIAAISSQKFAKGGKLEGPSHSEGGMPIINPVTMEKVAEIEGGEYILSKDTVANNRELADALLDTSMNKGGRSIIPPFESKQQLPKFGNGGALSMRPFWETRPYKAIDYPTVNTSILKVKYATGGAFQSATSPGTSTSTDPVLLEMLKQQHEANLNQQAINASLMDSLNNLNGQLSNGIEASVSLRKFDIARAQQDRIKKDASFT